MANYTKTTDFAAKDTLPGGDTNKVVRGTEFETEFDAISTAIATKSDTASPTFTGTVTIPTVDINAGAIDGTTIGASSAAAGTFTNLTASGTVNFNGATISNLGTITTANLDGGTIDNAVIGGSTAAAGSFTTLAASSSLTVGGAAVLTTVTFSNLDAGAVTTSGETFTNSDTQIPTNAAVKAHVEAVIPTLSVTEASVTAHQAALAIAATQITSLTSTVSELNILDGVTATASELNILDGVTSTTAELNILDGVTSTASELNILDGVTSTAAELNLVDGSSANTVVNSKAVIYGSAGEVKATQVDITGQGDLRLQDTSGGQYVGLQAPGTVGSSFVLTLPAADGSANQILKTDGAGNLSFTTVASGGLTHLSTVTASAASTVDIETTFDSTYDAYKLIITDMTVGTDGAQVQGLLKIGGSYITSATYDFLHRRLGVDTTGQIFGGGFGNDNNIIVAQSTANDAHASANFEFNIYNPTDTAIRHIVRFLGSYYEDDNDIHHVYGIGQNSTTGALTGIRFQVSTGTISGKFRLYGITNG